MDVLTRRNVLLGATAGIAISTTNIIAAARNNVPKVIAECRGTRDDIDPNIPYINVGVMVPFNVAGGFGTAVPLTSTNPNQIVLDIIDHVLSVGKSGGFPGFPQDARAQDVVVFGGPS